ncbi:hypothetical protein AtNW77_Chr5g0113931 [Arabidopsis thaliana]|uniref:Uncharacterized protein n=2 Tax=Arabidopsis TaxID=3701 RepID=A0A178UCE5_ARATH|nr:hypothetical protein AXX17_AT5G28990 [Arabidopsis thaliana]
MATCPTGGNKTSPETKPPAKEGEEKWNRATKVGLLKRENCVARSDKAGGKHRCSLDKGSSFALMVHRGLVYEIHNEANILVPRSRLKPKETSHKLGGWRQSRSRGEVSPNARVEAAFKKQMVHGLIMTIT